jgi:hypothetical protein
VADFQADNMNWPAIELRMRANALIAADRTARGDHSGARRLLDWNSGFVRCCEIFCGKPAGAFAHLVP